MFRGMTSIDMQAWHFGSKVFSIVSRYTLIESPLMHGNIQKETDTKIEKKILKIQGVKLCDSSKQ